jgi:hypothetical protein
VRRAAARAVGASPRRLERRCRPVPGARSVVPCGRGTSVSGIRTRRSTVPLPLPPYCTLSERNACQHRRFQLVKMRAFEKSAD